MFNVPNTNPFKQFLDGKYVVEDREVKKAIVVEIAKFFAEKMDFC